MAKEFNPLGRWEPTKQRDILRKKWIGVKDVTFRLPNGETMEHYYIAEKPSVVVVIPVRNGQTYLIREYERGVAEVGHKFPGGKMDNGETPYIAAGREFGEELGLKPKKLIPLGEAYVDPGFMTTRAHYFLGVGLEEAPEKKVEDPRELFEGKWVDLANVAEGIANNTIKNPFVIVGYILASNYLANHSVDLEANS